MVHAGNGLGAANLLLLCGRQLLSVSYIDDFPRNLEERVDDPLRLVTLPM
jgi:hypothetical protein